MEDRILSGGLAPQQWIGLVDLRSNERFKKVKENRRVSTEKYAVDQYVDLTFMAVII